MSDVNLHLKKKKKRYIAAESLPIQYGGLNRENDEEFSPLDGASELKIKGNSTAYIEFPVSEVLKNHCSFLEFGNRC